MPRFDPGPDEEVHLDLSGSLRSFRVVSHPRAPEMAHAMEGAKAVVYRLKDQGTGTEYALKVFKLRYRDPELVRICTELDKLKGEPGLAVCERCCLVPTIAPNALSRFPELEFSVLMPWITGRSWFDALQSGGAPVLDLDRARARRLATHLAIVLAHLEHQRIAHCDLSSGNLLIDETALKVHLIDVEDLHAPGLSQPAALPAGTPGYQHKTAVAGLWKPAADRFAGAVLLAEILGWYDGKVRANVFGDSYFDPAEIQSDCERFQVLHRALEQQAPDLASLWRRAWAAANLEDCPKLSAWEEACRSLFPFTPLDVSQIVIESSPEVFWSGVMPLGEPETPSVRWNPVEPTKRFVPPVRWDGGRSGG